MSESFGKKFPQDPKKEKTFTEDEEIKGEMDEMEKKHYKKENLKIGEEFRNEVGELKKEEDKAIKIVGFVNYYIENNSEKVSKEMSLGEFLDFINDEDNKFGRVIRNMINIWVDKYEGKINLEKSLDSFLESVEKGGKEASFLLNPGLENTK